MYEAVGLGLVAEGIAHEMDGILEELVQRTNRALPRARRSGDSTLVGYVEAVRATVSALRKQVSFLDPMLRGTREQRTKFSVARFVEEFVELRRDRLARFSITVAVQIEKDFTVQMSRGRLQQVLDNLTRNSEYWLRQKRFEGPWQSRRIITFEVLFQPNITVSDSGPGVRQVWRTCSSSRLFRGNQPVKAGAWVFFISRQLLQRDGCDARS